MAIEQGTQVVVISGGPTAGTGDFHQFNVGNIVTATGKVYDFNPEWELFRNDEGLTTWLAARHYQLVKQAKVVDSNLPTKVIYGILKDKEIVATTADREQGRNVKSILGGKAKGVSLYAYVAQKEIR